AAVAGSRHLSYGELSSRSSLLAGYLVGLGAGPESVVGLCVERSLELVVGTWGALLSGASYVPLDPDYPGERLAYMLADSGARVVLTTRSSSRRLDGALPAGCRR